MASYYELTEDEVQLLLEALVYFKINQGTYGSAETDRYLSLKHYLETRERRLRSGIQRHADHSSYPGVCPVWW